MNASAQLWRAQTLVVEPSGSGRGHAAEVKDRAGAPLATSDAEGTLSDQSGAVLLRAPLREGGRGRNPADVGVEVAGGDGRPLGEVRVVKYRLGPRARSLTLEVRDTGGGEVARLEPRDKKGDRLGVAAGGTDVATVTVEVVKKGFLRKSRIYTAHLVGDVPEAARPLVLAGLIRYDAMLKAVMAASMSD